MGSAPLSKPLAKAARFRAEADRAIALAARALDDESRNQLEHIARVYRSMANKLDPTGAPSPPADAPQNAGEDIVHSAQPE